MTNDKQRPDDHFKAFAFSLERAIARYGDISEEDVTERQKAQLERLVALEDEFRKTLIKHPWGNDVYKGFVSFICGEKRNILAARPFFRERQGVFTKSIAEALKAGNEKGLYPFNFNFQFVKFVLRNRVWPAKSKIVRLSVQIENARTELVEMNMPLAISRSRIFWNKTPKSHLEYMDFVQIACEGLIAAIDKFCLPYSPVFRSVAIGRMVGNFIEQYSETQIHFYPTDKRKLYRANKAVGRLSGEPIDFEAMVEAVNHEVEGNHKTSAAEIADIMAASSCVSADTPATTTVEGEGGSYLDRFASAPEQQPDNLVETADAYSAIQRAMDKLEVIERKFIALRGVDL